MRYIPSILLFFFSVIFCRAQTSDSIPPREDESKQYSYRNILSTPQVSTATPFLEKIRIGGWAQGCFQYGGQYARLGVGGPNDTNDSEVNRIGLRAARIRTVFVDQWFLVWFQVNFSEAGVSVRDAFIRLNEPWLKSFSLDLGQSNVPFGKETPFFTTLIEAETKALAFTSFIPFDRDMGLKLAYNLPQKFWFDYLQLNASLLSGTGMYVDTDNRKNWAFKVQGAKSFGPWKLELGGSYYTGGVFQPTPRVFRMDGPRFVCDSSSVNKQAFAHKWAWDVSAELTYKSPWGEMILRGEYIRGQQPSTLTSNKSLVYGKLPDDSPDNDIYIRPFDGAAFYLIQKTRNAKHMFSVRYDWYNPNTALRGTDIGVEGSHTSSTDVRMSELQFNYFFFLTKHLRLSAHYGLVDNTRCPSLGGWENNRNDNLFTAKVQVSY